MGRDVLRRVRPTELRFHGVIISCVQFAARVVKRAEDFASGIYVLAQAKEIVTSGDLSGWTVEGLKPGVRTLVGVRNGQLRLNVCGGTCLVFR